MIDILPLLNASVLLIMGSMLIFCFIRKAQDSQVKPPGVYVGLTAITWGVSIVCITHAILFSPKNDWNGVLLTPPLALLNGIDIHALPGKGPLIPSTYGPVFFLIFMPSCFVFESPTWMIMSGVLVNFLVGFLPIFFAVQQTIRFEFKRFGVLAVSGLILLIILQRPSLSSAYFNIHCDTPAIGAAFAACLFLLPRKENIKRASLFWSALFCSLSIWSKQTMLVLAVILSIFILLVYGWKTFARFVAYLGIINITITAICVWIFGLQNLWFHMIELVRNQPWYMSNLNSSPWLHRYDLQIGSQKIGGAPRHQFATLAVAGFILFRDNLLWLMALVLGITADISNIKNRRRDWFGEIKKRNWFLFVLVMLFMIPASVLPLVKVGGYVNNKAFFEIFLIFSVIIIWSDIRRPSGGMSQSALIGIVISLILVANTPRIIYAFSHTELNNDNNQEIVYQFEKKYPGIAYFPWHPLPVLLAENKLYHFDYTVLDLFYAGYLLPKEKFSLNLPSKRKFLAYHQSNGTRFILQQYFPEYIGYKEIKSLPGFVILGPPQKANSGGS